MNEGDLERLVIDNAAFEQLDAAMNVFCPFDAVGMVDQEVKHARFLQYVLDPARPHGFGAECLRAFMRCVAHALTDAGLGFAPLDVHLMEFEAAVVHRERDAIDLLIEVGQEQLIVAIELKINASEHSGQLGRYRQVVERNWPGYKHLLLFLTKRGEEPSEDGEGWRALSLASVADALASVAQRPVGTAESRMMLAAYIAMLRRKHVTDQRLEDLAAGLWREHKEALEFLMERRPDDRYAVLSILHARRNEAATRLSTMTGLTIVADHAQRSNVRFAVEDWDRLPHFMTAAGWGNVGRAMLVEVKDADGRVKPQFILGPTPWRQQIFDAFVSAGVETGYSGGINKSFRQLAITTFSPDPEDSDDQLFDKLLACLAAFLQRYVADYAPVLEQVLTSGAPPP